MPKLYAVTSTGKPKKPLQLAREAMKRHQKGKAQPIVNIHDRDDPAPTLPVDEVLRKSQGDHLGKK